LPLIERGVPVTACVLERAGDTGYMSRFKVIVLSEEGFRPQAQDLNDNLADWVRRGGVLIVLGSSKPRAGDHFWWHQAGFASPLDQLMKRFEMSVDTETQHEVGRGYVIRRSVSPQGFASPTKVETVYLPLIQRGLDRAEGKPKLVTPGRFCMRRGDFIIAHSVRHPVHIKGPVVDIFDPDLPVLDEVRLEPGMSGLYRDVRAWMDTAGSAQHPQVLHATHRLVSEYTSGNRTEITVRGPTETPGVVRLYGGQRGIHQIGAVGADGRKVVVQHRQAAFGNGHTFRIQFPNDPTGVVITVEWE